MTERNGQLVGMIPAEDPTTARRSTDERPTAECEMPLDAAKSLVVSHALTASSAVALSSTGEKQQPFAGIGNMTRPSSAASSDPGKQNLPLSQTQYDYWRKALAGAPALLDLPTDRPRASHRSMDVSKISIQLDTSLTQLLKKVAMEYDMDLSMVVMTGWGAVLARLSKQDDIVIGLQHSGPGELGGEKQTDDTGILPLRMDLSGEPNISQLLVRVRKMASSMDHQGFPLNGIADITSTPLFHVAFQWNSQTPLQSFSTSIHHDIELQLREQDNEVLGNMVFSSDLFNPDTIKRHIGYLITTLEAMVNNPVQPIATIDILSPEERRLILETWNETSEAYPDNLCIHQLFEHRVDKTPDATAIVYEGQYLTYGELNSHANRLAHYLFGLGVRPDTRVAICVERSPAMIVGILAILKAGGAYVPLDPSYAGGRIKDILQDASPTIAVADQTGRAALEDPALVVVDPNMLLDYPTSNCSIPGLTSRHLAYLIYTSGSTGKPKGVMIEHRGVVNLSQTHRKLCGFHPTARVLQFASCGFDTSVWEILLTLTSGASLYIPPAIVRQDRNELWNYMARHSTTLAAVTPSFFQDGKDLPEQTMTPTLVLGGEALSVTLLQNLISRGCTVINDYGPTETTVSAISWRCPPNYEKDVVTIGRPLCNTRIYILDSCQQPVPLGVTGEMYIGGIGVARGYLNRPQLTAERFLLDPFVDDPEARMYRTGDLARYLSDGDIVFLGRNDEQVKIRGFRIELGEIETCLSEHSLVQKAAVLALGEGSAKRLVAYVVAKPEDQLVHKLRAHLVSRLPDYMIPAAIVRLDNLPLTSNDKIDRRALPEPDSSAFAQQAYEGPRGEIETCLAQLWAELLFLDRVGRHDDFFVLGGHSLLAVRMLNRLRQHGFATSISAVYQSPVLSALAHALEEHQSDSIPPNLITPQTTKLTPEMLPLINLSQSEIDQIVEMTPGGVANIQDIYSLSSFQDGVLFHHLLTTEGDPYLISAQMAFETRDLLDRYLQAFQEVVNRHDILRTAFVWKDILTHAQVVWRQASLPIQELTLDPADGPIANQMDERFHPKHYRIDLMQAPLLRFALAQDTDGRWILFQLIHHLIGDHVAAEIMNHEIEQILHGQGYSLATPYPFRNAIAQSRSKLQHDIHEPFFQDMLGDIDEPTFPFGMAEVQNNGADVAESHSILSQELNNRLRFQAKQIGVSLASLCHVAWSLVLARTSGQERVVFGTVLFGGQNDREVGPTMGISINTLPFRCDINSQSVRECIHLAHIRLAALLEHENASLALAQKSSGVPAGTPLFSALLNYIHTSLPRGNSERLDVEFTSEEERVHYPGIEFLGGRERTNYPIGINVLDYGTDLGLAVQTQPPIDPSRVENYMKQALESLVDALENDPDMAVTKLEILPPDERELLIHGFNTTQQDYPAGLCIHHLFEQQVDFNPQATALMFSGQSLTYSELNVRANRLAHHLIGLGVQPDHLVAICVERSFAMIVGILGILKAGGAYVPLDPAYASNRLKGILFDASPSIVVVDTVGSVALGEAVSSMTVVNPNELHDPDQRSEMSHAENITSIQCLCNPQLSALTPSHLAYIIYTSGSTGKPKGAMIEHRGAVSLIHGGSESFGISNSSRVLQFTSLSFDNSVLEIFPTLSCGASLHLVQDDVRLDQNLLWEYVRKHSITIGDIVNSYGPTETTVAAITWRCPQNFKGDSVPIGRPLANKTIYILDQYQQPVPMGAEGELYIGGVGVARGYLNRTELTSKVFLHDPFAGDKDARMYKTGDLGRYLPDGNIVYLGRNDDQVKIRGFRIELGEIEARLSDHPLVDKAAVITIGEGSEKRLVAYVVSKNDGNLPSILRAHLTSCLPEYMIPAAIVRLDSIPINPNGKLDRKALPVPDNDVFARQMYEKPQGETEIAVAKIWAELLHLDHVSRTDNFFALGGHSLLAIQMIERLRRIGLSLAVSALFKTPTLSALVQSLDVHETLEAPINLITPHTTTITPEMVPLITLSQTDIDHIVHLVPGGVSNIQDIYALSPLQEGILFHHLLATEGDPYLLISFMSFETRELLDKYLKAMQMVVDRHDVMRTAILHENLSVPAQVVWCHASLSVDELELDPSNGPILEQLKKRLDPRRHRIDITQAPLLRFTIAQDTDGQWILAQLLHHLSGDHATLEVTSAEIKAFMDGRGHTLPPPQPFRNLIAQARSSQRQDDHERFFKEMLQDIDTPSLPFGLKDVHGQGYNVTTSYQPLPQDLNDRLRKQAKYLGVSVASLCHLAWAQVISHTSGEDRVVFGTVLFGRMNSGQGSDSAMGLFINTLSLRVDLTGTVRESVLQTHERLASLLAHEHASLALAQRCSNVPQGTPLFSAMLNYRHNATPFDTTSVAAGIRDLEYQEYTNYPITLSVEDFGVSLGLTADVVQPFNPNRVRGYMQQALENMAFALEHAPDTTAHGMNILPECEQELLLRTWNTLKQDYPANMCIHHVFEQQVERTPQATALVFNSHSMTYAELNERANRLAHHLIGLRVQPDSLAAVCVERSSAMVIGVLGILKAGGAYVPLDPAYASDRLRDILADAAPSIVIADESGRRALGERVLSSLTVVNPDSVVALDKSKSVCTRNPQVQDLTASNLAYVIFTSGSTGKPKGVMIEHRGVVSLAQTHTEFCGIQQDSRVLSWASLSFDASVWDMMLPLSCGASLYLLADSIRQDRDKVWEYMAKHSITHASFTPSFLHDGKSLPTRIAPLTLVLGGEPLGPALLQKLMAQGYTVINDFGPTELTVSASTWCCPSDFKGDIVPIGRPVIHSRIYLLDKRGHPVPLGAIGEMYVGGIGVARGYLNHPELTAKAFLPDPFTEDKDARMYKTGDLARYLPDGNLVYLGRNDRQVKIRGFRIELGEIDARLVDHPLVDEAAVIAIGEGSEKRLVAYVVAKADDNLLNTLRAHLTSCLPDYMVPAAIVRLDSLPINSNGKLDRKALPAPDSGSFAHQVYEEPQGETETTVARIWADLLHVGRVGRNDNFFALGGHSLLAVQMIERLRRAGLTLAVSALFKTPTLSTLVQSLDVHKDCDAPTNLIMPGTTNITPAMLPLITLSQEDIDHIVRSVPGGVANIQDIYSLSPLQEGILFHHLLATEGDPYLDMTLMAFETRELLDKYLGSVQMVVNRHDILRTAVLYENLSTPAQVVWRQASLSITELQLDPSNGPTLDQLKKRFDPQRHRIDITQAPLLRFTIAQDIDGQWILAQLLHHLSGDHATLEVTSAEIKAFMDGRGHTLPSPQPFRNLIAQARSSQRQDDHERFFKEMLQDIDTPSLPFGLKDVHGQGDNVTTSYKALPQDLNDRLRRQAKQLGVSVASLCHLAWAQVISCTSGEDRVVFGTVLFGRMNSGQGSDSAMGLFINTLPLRVDLTGTVRESVFQTHERLASLLDHEHASLALAQRCSNVPQGTPLFSAMLNYRHNVALSDTTSIAPGIEYLDGQERTNYPFTLSVEDFGVSLGLTVNVVQPFSPVRVCGYMQQALESLASALDHAPDTIVSKLNILPEGEQETLLRKWNTTHQDYPADLCIHHLFEQQVERTPHAIALVFNGESMTYTELNNHANTLAYHLIELGIQPDSLVAICVERSFAMIIGVIAVLKAGGAYVPLDPAYPKERLAYILEDAAPAIALVDSVGRTTLIEASQYHQKDTASMTMIDPNVPLSSSVENPKALGLTSRHLAYIVYTSGSTGRPKGVMIEHQGVVNYALARMDDFDLDSGSRMLQFASLSFDVSVMEMFTAFYSGACLHLLQDSARLDRQELWRYIEKHIITHAVLPPAVLQECKNCSPLSTRLTLISAGEELSAALVRALQRLVPNGRIINEYGPTEITVIATHWICPQDFKDAIVPIGRPIANKKAYILDNHRQLVPNGAVGELYIGGVGVARGYLNRLDLTSKTFLHDPFADDKDARMYKTGDLAQYLPDGNILFLGRNDHQVKVRGFRVELGEIEARLSDHPLVQSAAVVMMGEGSGKKLVGYVVAAPGDTLVNILRSHLTSCLPEYMIPAAIVILDSLPINSNGKLDRKALPAPDISSFARQVYEEPQGETETAVARVWEELLHLDRVGRSDNFFALGGHSLLAVQMVERLRRIGLSLAVGALFKAPTLSALVQSLDVHKDCDTPTNLIALDTINITPAMLPLITLSQEDIDHIVRSVPGGVANIQDIYSLSPLQEGILFHHLLATEGDPYLQIILMAFETRELLDKYLGSVQMVVNRHDILRTAVLYENLTTPAQVVWRHAPLSLTELQLDPSNGSIPDQLKHRLDPRQYRIDVTQAPMMRFTVAQDTDGRWILVDLYHHLISDHTTLEVMFNETKAFMNDQGHTLPAPQPFRNLIAQAKLSHKQEDHERFFKEMLQDIDTPSLPFGLKDVHGQGDNVTTSYKSLSQGLNDRLRRQAKQLGVSVASLCHLAWAQVISCTSGEDRVVFGTVLFGRMNSGQGSDSAMGVFINTLPLRVDLTGTVRESVLQTHERLASLLDHEHASLALAQRCSSVPQGTPLFSAMMNYRHNVAPSDTTSIAPGIEYLDGQERTNYPFTLSVEDFGVSLGLTADVVQPFSPVRVCGYMQRALESLVSALEQAPGVITHELSIIPEDEQELLLREWNATQQSYPVNQCIHHVFEQRVEHNPQATALVFNGQSLTYAELNERANRLAHHLISLGVQPDTCVAICVNRSLALIVGVLAILKAGGAYVPIDPTNPKDRLEGILEDASPRVMLVDTTGRSMLRETGVLCSNQKDIAYPVTVDPNDILSSCNTNPRVPGLTSRHLAYIIYTSGSTGKPKGVMIEHQGVVSRVQEHNLKESSRFLQFTPLNFDVSVLDIFTTLCSGASLHLLQDDARRDLSRLWDYLRKNAITHTSLTATVLQDIKGLSPLRTPLNLTFVGETLPPALPHALRQTLPEGSAIVNEYGPTEATIAAVRWNCKLEFDGDLVPIGRPIYNVRIYILDTHRRPIPLGAIGELYIGGVGVARGYLNRPELTSSVFLPDPFADDKDAKMYKTGDLARYLPDGNIIFLGRNDHQVKIRGFRVELGEIEARLRAHPLAQSAAVVAVGDGSDKRLVAYVVARHDDQLVHTLRSHLTSCLPHYMVPAAIVRLDSLPLSANGKLDRRRLPQPDNDAMAYQQYEPPHGDMESALMIIWVNILSVDKIGRHDNFFMLGGHSLLAVRMISQVQSLMGYRISLGTLFMAPTIAELVPHMLTAGNTQEDAFDVLLPIQPRGTRRPLFCVHHGVGISWSYIGLSRHLHPDQPIYGLQARGFFEDGQFANAVEDMAVDYIEQIRRIQPHGPYCLLGYSFGGVVVHTMVAQLENQGERVALLAVMDTVPNNSTTKRQAAIERQNSEAREEIDPIQLFTNRVESSLPDRARSYLERLPQVVRQLSKLSRSHTSPCCKSGMIPFRAMVQKDPSWQLISPDVWRPHVMGEIDVFDIDCDHNTMDQPVPLAEIGSVLSQRLNEIHAMEAKEL
ncbi:MAG: syringopeptin synthetase b [Benniella sp.]|nr:MAG: syringopeptin synthetase b [Benniella sp.]